MRGVGVIVIGYVIACGFAAIFSGSVTAPLTAMPVAALTGLLGAWLIVKDIERG